MKKSLKSDVEIHFVVKHQTSNSNEKNGILQTFFYFWVNRALRGGGSTKKFYDFSYCIFN